MDTKLTKKAEQRSLNLPRTNVPLVVIVGGGFAGLEMAKALKHTAVQVLLLDKNNYHTFVPLLYQVATAGLEPDSVAYPLRKVFGNQKNAFIRMGEALKIDPQTNTLYTNLGYIKYDFLVLATGTTTNYFGMESIEQQSMPMKSVVEALDLRSLILQNFEKAILAKTPKQRRALLNFVIVGGGPTGVELAGALGELRRRILPKDYPELDYKEMNIYLLDMVDTLLSGFDKASGKAAKRFLENDFGVKVLLNTQVEKYEQNTVYAKTKTSDKEEDIEIPTKNLIWAAGIKGSIVSGIPPTEQNLGRGKRYIVDAYNKMQNYDNIYAIGDVCLMPDVDPNFPKGHPQLAPVAQQMGVNLAKNIGLQLQNKSLVPFRYKDKGKMATVGRNKAVAETGNFKTQGFLAWLMWMGVHLLLLVGFRNKVITLFNWAWNYFSYDRGVRLIIRPFKQKKRKTLSQTTNT